MQRGSRTLTVRPRPAATKLVKYPARNARPAWVYRVGQTECRRFGALAGSLLGTSNERSGTFRRTLWHVRR